MDAVFYGDSITEGSNSSVRFTDFLENIDNDIYVTNNGVSGTTLGEYSIYPVDGLSLLGLLDMNWHQSCVKGADKIFIEYGINDTTAVMCGFATIQQVVVNFVKALDWIKQLNPKAKVYFLILDTKYDTIFEYAKRQCDYLENDYFKHYGFKFPPSVWAKFYMEIISKIIRSDSVDCISIFKDMDFDVHISSDNMHPNLLGHKVIADNIKEYI